MQLLESCKLLQSCEPSFTVSEYYEMVAGSDDEDEWKWR